MEYAIKHNTAPIHSSKAKPPNSCLQNFTHSGVVLGGVRAFGPSRSKISFAFACVKPCTEKRERKRRDNVFNGNLPRKGENNLPLQLWSLI